MIQQVATFRERESVEAKLYMKQMWRIKTEES